MVALRLHVRAVDHHVEGEGARQRRGPLELISAVGGVAHLDRREKKVGEER